MTEKKACILFLSIFYGDNWEDSFFITLYIRIKFNKKLLLYYIKFLITLPKQTNWIILWNFIIYINKKFLFFSFNSTPLFCLSILLFYFLYFILIFFFSNYLGCFWTNQVDWIMLELLAHDLILNLKLYKETC